MSNKTDENWVLIILCLGAIYFLSLIGTIQDESLPGGLGPRTFPIGIFISILVLSVTIFINSFVRNRIKQKGSDGSGDKSEQEFIWRILPKFPKKAVFISAMMICFVFAMQYLGFIVSSIVFMAASALFLSPSGKKSYLFSTILAIGFTTVITVFFVFVFDIPLPMGFSK